MEEITLKLARQFEEILDGGEMTSDYSLHYDAPPPSPHPERSYQWIQCWWILVPLHYSPTFICSKVQQDLDYLPFLFFFCGGARNQICKLVPSISEVLPSSGEELPDHLRTSEHQNIKIYHVKS
ncbi:hypothetical protein OCU04_005083 [Sclerotinia nivalis]|uniref:Uncharacterized protein n=1 Tax=Sclerotinia nivalis TaxID=352851 RepID=A0A9X0DJK8_9HELO|nr:hypothetical protein OCU04_005083 [Sclerotinia nivalis]